MSTPDEKPSPVPPPLGQQLRHERRRLRRFEERETWGAYFAGAFTVFPLVGLWLSPALGLSARATFWASLGAGVVAGFLAQRLYNRFRDPPE